MLFTERAVIGDYVCYPRPLDEERDRAVSTPQAAKSSNPYPELPRIYNLRARPISDEEQVVFWDNPYRADLVAYQFYACRTENRTGPKPHEKCFTLESQGIQWRSDQRYHGVILNYAVDDPWNLCFFVRVVGTERHGQFIGTHLAGRYRETTSLSTLRMHHQGPVLEISRIDEGSGERKTVTISGDMWAGPMQWGQICAVEEAVHGARPDSLIERETQDGWEKIPAGLRKSSRVGRAWGNFTKHATVPDTPEHIRNFDGSPCRFVPLEIAQRSRDDL